jgi:hypothetical protein
VPTPPTGRPRGLRTSVHLEPADLAVVDEVAARTGWSRNEAIRALLRLGFRLRETIPSKYPGVALSPPPAAQEVGRPPDSDSPRRASAA